MTITITIPSNNPSTTSTNQPTTSTTTPDYTEIIELVQSFELYPSDFYDYPTYDAGTKHGFNLFKERMINLLEALQDADA